MSNQINNANDSSSIIQAPVISFPYNRYAYSVATSFQVSAKSQSEGSDLFKNLNALSIVNSSQYWNLTNTQVGDTCDFDKIFNPADIQI